MKTNNILTGREYLITGKDTGGSRLTWYSHQNYLKERFRSVLRVELVDTTSSCGDWSGFILQRQGNNVLAIDYSQKNVYGGFVVNTGKVFASFPYRLLDKKIKEITELFTKIFYR